MPGAPALHTTPSLAYVLSQPWSANHKHHPSALHANPLTTPSAPTISPQYHPPDPPSRHRSSAAITAHRRHLASRPTHKHHHCAHHRHALISAITPPPTTHKPSSLQPPPDSSPQLLHSAKLVEGIPPANGRQQLSQHIEAGGISTHLRYRWGGQKAGQDKMAVQHWGSWQRSQARSSAVTLTGSRDTHSTASEIQNAVPPCSLAPTSSTHMLNTQHLPLPTPYAPQPTHPHTWKATTAAELSLAGLGPGCDSRAGRPGGRLTTRASGSCEGKGGWDWHLCKGMTHKQWGR